MPPVTRALLGLLVGALASAVGCAHRTNAAPVAAAIPPVELRFLHSPYADYLFFLLYRDSSRVSALKTIALDSVPTLSTLIALPEITLSSRIQSYREILPLVNLYRQASTRLVTSPAPRILTYGRGAPNYDSLRLIVDRGESAFPSFLRLWTRDIEPEELRNIEVWREQAATCHPMDSLQALTRLTFPSRSIDVGAIHLHFSGSGNYTPMGVYSRTFDRPNLAFTLGHEATHLLVNPLTGHNWRTFPAARQALSAAGRAGLGAEDLDELLALLMQVKLPQACGLTAPSRRISDAFKADTVRYRVLTGLEDHWMDYLADHVHWPTIIEYFLDQSEAALRRP